MHGWDPSGGLFDIPTRYATETHEWRDKHTKLLCRASRSVLMGMWNGYVAVSPSHPWWRRDYEEIDAKIHGGLEFAGEFYDSASANQELWWVGFSCSHMHLGDAVPSMAHVPFPGLVLRELPFVRAECAKLAAQAYAARPAPLSSPE